MSKLSVIALKDRLGIIKKRLSMVDSNDLEINEMCMLLRANVDDVNLILDLNTHTEESLVRTEQVISNLLVGVDSIQKDDVPSILRER